MLVTVGVLLAVGVAADTVRRILVPVPSVGAVLIAMADGDLTGRASIGARDEIGPTASAVDATAGQPRETISIVAETAAAYSPDSGCDTPRLATHGPHPPSSR